MQSSPSAEFIKISFSVKGKFTARMVSELKIGKVVDLKLPYGELFQKDFSKSNVVFIAGGTGITPFLSLFSHDSFNEYIDPKIYLGFKSESYNIYADALSKLNSNNLKIMYESVDGILNIDSIFNENSIKSHYFISGPPQMIKGFKRELVLKGVPQDQILTDEWD
jgi:predicted ferric reductase